MIDNGEETGEGWLDLVVVLDRHSRRVVGWATGTRIDHTLGLTALDRALVERQSWTSRIALTAALARSLDGWYNPVRRHSRLGYLSPVALGNARDARPRTSWAEHGEFS